MTDHCFISYSNADAADFAHRLADALRTSRPPIGVWIDDGIHPGDWDEQVDQAIRSCKCLLFLVSPDSVADGSICTEEWDWAIRCKKPVIPLMLSRDVEPPFRLRRRQYVDFTGDFVTGLAELRQYVVWLASPEGVLQGLKDRLADAQRDLRRNPANEPRIKAEIDDLTAKIANQEEIVRNPQAAQAQTQKNIDTGLEREREPVKPVTGKGSTKFINPRPSDPPGYFQDRVVETKLLCDFLVNNAQRMIAIVGRGGVGKTAMVCRLLKHLESDTVPDELKDKYTKIPVDGIVYLSEIGSHHVNFANLFADLSKLLPAEKVKILETLYKDPLSSTSDKMLALLESFSEGRTVLLLDNFENVVDDATQALRETELKEALNALLSAPSHTVKVVITTRVAPNDLTEGEASQQMVLRLDEGLSSPYAENILRELDPTGMLGLKEAPDELLDKARKRTRGYPRALEAIKACLEADYNTKLEDLLKDDNIPLPERVVQKLVGEAFSRLDNSAQKIMQALAIYNRPVTPAAVDYLLQPFITGINSAPILNRLANMHFVRRESGRFYLHPVDREYSMDRVPETVPVTAEHVENAEVLEALKESIFSQHDLTLRAADYFAQARKPRAEWKKLDDLSAQLAEFDLRCAAGDYETATTVLTDIGFNYLHLWGHYRLLIGLYERVVENIQETKLRIGIVIDLASAQQSIGQIRTAIVSYEEALDLSKKNNSRYQEGAALTNLGIAYAALGDIRKAIEYYEQALVIDREIGDRAGEGTDLGNLGNRYAEIGTTRRAIEYYEQALVIDREIGERAGEGINLSNLGIRYAELGDIRKAIEFYEQALVIHREIGNRSGESINLENTGHVFLSLEKYGEAQENYRQAIQIADEISLPMEQLNARWGLAQAYLLQNDLPTARVIIEAALQYDVPQYNHNATALHGIIALRQGERETAQEAFMKSIAQADEILAKTPDFYDALDAKGLSICGLTICDLRLGREELLAEAVETFRKAREIAPHAGVVKSVLRLFDELVKCDEEGVLKDVRKAVEGK